MLVGVVLGPLMTLSAYGHAVTSHTFQNQNAALPAKPGFDVATIKSAEDGPRVPRFMKLEGTNRYTARNYNLKLLIAAAYNVSPKAISGGPDWLESAHFDIEALTPGQKSPSRDEQMAMLARLLEDRFKLMFHREPKVFSIYALEVTKDGPKLKATASAPTDPSNVGPGVVYPQKIVMPAHNATMSDFVAVLQRAVLDRPVVDMTGLTGRYDFVLEWAPDESQFGGALPAASDDAPSLPLFQAVQSELGLKLEARRGPIATIVIDHAEHPSPN